MIWEMIILQQGNFVLNSLYAYNSLNFTFQKQIMRQTICNFNSYFRHKRTSSNKSAASYSSIVERGINAGCMSSPATGNIRFTSPSISSNKQLLEEGPELNFGGIFVIWKKMLAPV